MYNSRITYPHIYVFEEFAKSYKSLVRGVKKRILEASARLIEFFSNAVDKNPMSGQFPYGKNRERETYFLYDEHAKDEINEVIAIYRT